MKFRTLINLACVLLICYVLIATNGGPSDQSLDLQNSGGGGKGLGVVQQLKASHV